MICPCAPPDRRSGPPSSPSSRSGPGAPRERTCRGASFERRPSDPQYPEPPCPAPSAPCFRGSSFSPPLAVLVTTGFGLQFLLNILLWILGWLPGTVHALWLMNRDRPAGLRLGILGQPDGTEPPRPRRLELLFLPPCAIGVSDRGAWKDTRPRKPGQEEAMNEVVKPEAFSSRSSTGPARTIAPDTCSMLFEVKGGEPLSVRGNPDHPMTRGGLCVKLKDYEKRHYHPDRLLYPMRRVGPKGLEAVRTDHLGRGARRDRHPLEGDHRPVRPPGHRPPCSHLGNQGLRARAEWRGRLLQTSLGATVTERTFCGEGSCTAWLLTVGPTAGLDPES